MKNHPDHKPLSNNEIETTEFENDPIWPALEHATNTQPSPQFVDQTLRRVRIESHRPSPWWKSLFSPKPLITAGALAVLALAAVPLLTDTPNPTPAPIAKNHSNLDDTSSNELEDTLASAFLAQAVEDPELFSDQEIVSLIF